MKTAEKDLWKAIHLICGNFELTAQVDVDFVENAIKGLSLPSATAKVTEIVFIIDNGKAESKPYKIMELLDTSEVGILEAMETCDCKFNESANYCEGDCIKYEDSSITGYRSLSQSEVIKTEIDTNELKDSVLNILQQVEATTSKSGNTVIADIDDNVDSIFRIFKPYLETNKTDAIEFKDCWICGNNNSVNICNDCSKILKER